MNALRIAVCDDNSELANQLEKLINHYSDCKIKCDVYYSSSKLLRLCKEENHIYDLYILDIDMPNLSGIELAKQIREFDHHCYIVFLTSHSEYMPDAFKTHAYDYIIKPVKEEYLYALLKRICDLVPFTKSRFNFISKNVSYSIKLESILYFEKKGRYSYLHENDGSCYKIEISTKELLSKLNNQFAQVHASFIVNLNYVKGTQFNKIFITTSETNLQEIPISRKFQTEIKKKLIQYFGV